MGRPKKADSKLERGIFQRPPGSGIWWINYYVKGAQHREKAGRKSDAIALYQKRKADSLRGRKLPELMPSKRATFAHLMTDAIEYAKAHLRTSRDYVSKQTILTDVFGARTASDITPQEIDRWLSANCKTPATANRYKAFFSLCYKLGIKHGRVSGNPAKHVTKRKEDNGRLRFLSREEYEEIVKAIRNLHPKQLPSFVVSVYTGMRWGEQFGQSRLRWSQVNFDRKIIRLLVTKNGKPRNVPLNSVALAALRDQEALVPHKPTDPVFPLGGPAATWRWWFQPCLDEAKITDYVWHSNRHTFCSWLAMNGATLKDIQELAGHRDITMSARYAHLSPDAAASASERLCKA